jgi:hypothetical protein
LYRVEFRLSSFPHIRPLGWRNRPLHNASLYGSMATAYLNRNS